MAWSADVAQMVVELIMVWGKQQDNISVDNIKFYHKYCDKVAEYRFIFVILKYV